MMDVVAGTIIRDGYFLAAQRRSGVWEFPGGKVEPGETHQAALTRELREELGIESTISTFVGSHRSHRLKVSVYLVRSSGNPLPFEHLSLAWLNAENAHTLFWQQHDLPLLERLLRMLYADPKRSDRGKRPRRRR